MQIFAQACVKKKKKNQPFYKSLTSQLQSEQSVKQQQKFFREMENFSHVCFASLADQLLFQADF